MTHASHDASTTSDAELPIGAHLVTPRLGYMHHGIYVGENKVIHYAGLSLSPSWLRGPVEEVPLARFAGGRAVTIKPHAFARFSPQEAVARARSRLGEDRYRLTTNNCEHFCEWCLSGQSRSEQVDSLIGWIHATVDAATRLLKVAFGAGLTRQSGADDC